MASAVLIFTNWNNLIECLHLVNVDSNHQMVVQQHVMTRQMIFREINAPLEHVGVHGAGFAFMLAGNNPHPVAADESIVETHLL